jgi:[ribosomal protein S5]-alanine N-acetyltransferase
MEIGCGICKVRSWRVTDIGSLARHANNHRVWMNLRDRFPYPYSLADAERWVGFAVTAEPEVDFAIEYHGESVGGLGLTLGAREERHSAELGYWLGEEVWGKGIATAAVRSFAAFAGSTFGLWRIFAVPFSDNAASVRVLEKAGFEWEALMRCSAVKEGRIKDQYLYALLLGSCRDHLEGR